MPVLLDALTQLSDNKLDRECVEQVLCGLDALGAHHFLSLLRNALVDAGGDATFAQGRTLAQACRELCWEKIHTGNWREVDVEWRDAYTLCCLMGAAILLAPGKQIPTAQAAAAAAAATVHQPRPAHDSALNLPPQDAVPDSRPECGPLHRGKGEDGDLAQEDALLEGQGTEALQLLDMAALMGGPLLRPAVDGAIQQLQTRLQRRVKLQIPPLVPNQTFSGSEPLQSYPDSETFLSNGLPKADGSTSLTTHSTEGLSVPWEHGWDTAKRRKVWDASVETEALTEAPTRHLLPMAPTRCEAVLLPPGSLEGAAVTTERLPSLERFLCQHMLAADGGRPVVITGAMEQWPAMERWQSAEYLRCVAGMRTVPVEVGRHYLAEGWGQRLMPLSDFIERHLQHSAGAQAEAAGRGYLAQHPLFDQIPALRADLVEPEYCSLGGGQLQSINAWLGPPGTVTPLHHDPYHNLLSQVLGRKYVRLYPAAATATLRPHEGMNSNSSQVDLEGAECEVLSAVLALPVLDCILEPGQMLYIPPGWWHYVKALSVSFSVSFWWQ